MTPVEDVGARHEPESTPRRDDRWVARLVAAMMLTATVVTSAVLGSGDVDAATPTVTWGGSTAVTEQSSPQVIGSGISITNGTSYSGEYLDIAVTGATADDVLGYVTVSAASTTPGDVSIVGTSVYLANGSGTPEPIGSIDAVRNGSNGLLRINFTNEFPNASFEQDLSGTWTTIAGQFILGGTAASGYDGLGKVLGVTSPDTRNYGAMACGTAASDDDYYIAARDSFSRFNTEVAPTNSASAPDGTYALRLKMDASGGSGTGWVMHGPAVYSEPFEAAANDVISFDWKAVGGRDDYSVYGYLWSSVAANQITILDAFQQRDGDRSNWATSSFTIPTAGTYRFVFVAGAHNRDGQTGTTCSGSQGDTELFIDDLQVVGNKVDDTVATAVARLVTYASTADDPPASRTVTLTAVPATGSSHSATTTVTIAAVDDPPVFAAVTGPTVQNTLADDVLSASTGTVTASDPDSTPTYGLLGGVADPVTLAAVTYDVAITGTHGTLRMATTGQWRFEPDDTAIENVAIDTFEDFTVTASDATTTVSATLRVTLDVAESVPSPPQGLTAASIGVGSIGLGWNLPVWIGGSVISDYDIEYRSVGAPSWTALSDGVSALRQATVSALSIGADYEFRVAARNTTGLGPWSATTSAISATPPGMVRESEATSSALTTVTLAWTAPATTGGLSVTDYVVQQRVEGTSTWTTVSDPVTAVTGATLSGLAPGTRHEFRIAAANPIGTGAWSATVAAMSVGPPSAMTVTSLRAGTTTVDLDIVAPASTGGSPITGYEFSPDNGATWTPAVTVVADARLRVEGLASSAVVNLWLRAHHLLGAGATTSVTVRTLTPPPPPRFDDPDPPEDPTTPPPSTTPPQTPTGPVGPGVVPAPVGTPPTLVVPGDAPVLATPPGEVRGRVDGRPVDTRHLRIDEELRRTSPPERTVEHIVALRAEATELLAEFERRRPPASDVTVESIDTAEGAAVSGLVRHPVTGRDVPVPVEYVTAITFDTAALLLAATDSEGVALPLRADGVLEVQGRNRVGVAATGLDVSTTGEIVVLSTPRLLGRFLTDEGGEFRGDFTIPDDLEPGHHTLAFVTARLTTTLGIVVPTPENPIDPAAVLPRTGAGLPAVAVMAVLAMVLGLMALRGRRRLT